MIPTRRIASHSCSIHGRLTRQKRLSLNYPCIVRLRSYKERQFSDTGKNSLDTMDSDFLKTAVATKVASRI